MNKSIDILIRKAEDNWLEPMNQQLEKAFNGVFLPSHDPTHHKRVWENGKNILVSLSERNNYIDESLVEGLIISIFFHDQGMVLTRKKDHGKVSREMCEKFFSENKEKEPANIREILHAIENHDKKESRIYEAVLLNKRPDLLTILGISDDMDAIGTIGIYRYAEIYLHRGITIRKLGIKVLENVSTRFNNFLKICLICQDLSSHYKKAYSEIITFFDKYNQQLLTDITPENEFNGPIGIVNYIYNFSVKGKTPPTDFLKSLENFEVTKFVKDFFIKLEHELTQSN